ncbi:MAG: P-loop NTPase [Phascolarctobacterium faecium]
MQTTSGIEIISTNLLLNNETDPVVWRGPIIAGTVKQFWSDVIWTDIEYMFIDMPQVPVMFRSLFFSHFRRRYHHRYISSGISFYDRR